MANRKHKRELSEDLDMLLDELCQEWGFCNRLSGEGFFAGPAVLTSDTFADAVLVAEGMNPEHEPKWRRRIRAKFIERFGETALAQSWETRFD